jgi:hypothetical protein
MCFGLNCLLVWSAVATRRPDWIVYPGCFFYPEWCTHDRGVPGRSFKRFFEDESEDAPLYLESFVYHWHGGAARWQAPIEPKSKFTKLEKLVHAKLIRKFPTVGKELLQMRFPEDPSISFSPSPIYKPLIWIISLFILLAWRFIGHHNMTKRLLSTQPLTRTQRLALILLFAIGIVVIIVKTAPPNYVCSFSAGGEYSIGLYRSSSPVQVFNFSSELAPFKLTNSNPDSTQPVMTARHVTDISHAKFVADPFMVKQGSTLWMFFEVMAQEGEIAVARSDDNGDTWKYKQMVLDEPFHLSYPYVFEHNNNYYMVPETNNANQVRLYKAVEFPYKWALSNVLVEGKEFVDASIIYCNGIWWMFVSQTSNDIMYVYYSDTLESSNWKPHPQNPVFSHRKDKARPSGRVTLWNGKLIRYAMNNEWEYGYSVTVQYVEVTKTTFKEYPRPMWFGLGKGDAPPVLMGHGDLTSWNGNNMHAIDPMKLSNNEWLIAVDGCGFVNK